MTIYLNTNQQLYSCVAGRFELSAMSQLNLVCVNFVQKSSIQNIEVVFLGEGATCNIKILTLIKAGHDFETNVTIKHNARNCFSKYTNKGIFSGKSRVNIKTNVHISENATNSDSVQMHRALMISQDARVKIQPHLQIATDTVKCKHGVSVGGLDQEAIFYLLTRGLSEGDARKTLIHAFTNEIINSVQNQNNKLKLKEKVSLWF